jgi:hypothetical protein
MDILFVGEIRISSIDLSCHSGPDPESQDEEIPSCTPRVLVALRVGMT